MKAAASDVVGDTCYSLDSGAGIFGIVLKSWPAYFTAQLDLVAYYPKCEVV